MNIFNKIPVAIIPIFPLCWLLILYVYYLPIDTDLTSYHGDFLIVLLSVILFLVGIIVDIERILQNKLNWKTMFICIVLGLATILLLLLKLFLYQGCFVDC